MSWQKFRTLIDFIFLVAFIYLCLKTYMTEGTSKAFWLFFILAAVFVSDTLINIYNLRQNFRKSKS
jgi:uncharacterized membrane protein YpjA